MTARTEAEVRGVGALYSPAALSPGELRFGVRLISNFDEVVMPHCFFRFPNPEAVRSLGLKYTLRSHSLPKLVEGELHVVVSTGDAPAPGEE